MSDNEDSLAEIRRQIAEAADKQASRTTEPQGRARPATPPKPPSASPPAPQYANYVCTVCHSPFLNPAKTCKGSCLEEGVVWFICFLGAVCFLFVTVIVSILCLLCAMVYSIIRYASIKSACPHCKSPAFIPIDTPAAQRILAGKAG